MTQHFSTHSVSFNWFYNTNGSPAKVHDILNNTYFTAKKQLCIIDHIYQELDNTSFSQISLHAVAHAVM